MNITIKKIETDEEMHGKAYVHWKSWQETYPGLIDQKFLDNLTVEKCEELAKKHPDNTLIAKDGDKVVGFVTYGKYRWEKELADHGEIMAIYVLSKYYGIGVGAKLMYAGMCELSEYSKVALLVLKDNRRAIKFYEKCGFEMDGTEFEDETLKTKEVRMIMNRNQLLIV